MAGEPLIEELGLDVQPALDALAPLADALTALATDFAASLSDALATLTEVSSAQVDVTAAIDTTEAEASLTSLAADAPPVDVPVVLDTADAEAGLTALGDVAVDVPVTVTGDTAALTDEISSAVSAPETVSVDGDVGPLTAALADALDAPRDVSVDGDVTALTDAISATADTPVTVLVDADASAAQDAISSLDQTQVSAAVTADTTEAEAAIAGLDTAPVVVSVNADTSEAQSEIGALDTSPVTVSVDADTSEAQNEIDGLTGAANRATGSGGGGGGGGEGLSGLEGALIGVKAASAGAKGEVSAVGSEIGGLSAGLGGAVAGGAAFVGFIAETVKVSADAQAQQARFNQTFGDSAEIVKNINVGGLTTDLESLSRQTGTLVADLENSATRIGLLGAASGAAQPKVAGTASDLLGLAGALSVANPRLGDTAAVADTVSRALSTGRTRALIPYGISISQTAIQQRALDDNLGKTKDTLTGYDKLVAGLTLVLEQQGDTLGTKYAAGIQNAQVQLRALKVNLEETLVSIGGPLLEPVVTSLAAILPVAESVGRVLGGLAHVVLPGIKVAAFALTPLADVLNLVADGLNAIPTPLLAVAGGFVALSGALSVVFLLEGLGAVIPGIAAAFGLLEGGMLATAASAGLLSGALTLITGPIGITIAAIGLIATVTGVFSRGQKEAKLDVAGMTDALFGQASAAKELQSALGGLNTNLGEQIQKNLATGKNAEDVTQAIHALGISYDDLAKGVSGGDSAFEAFLTRLDAIGPAVGLSADQSSKLDDALIIQRKTLEASSGAQLDNLLATHQITQAQYDHIRSQHGINDAVAGSLESTGDYVAALKDATTVAQAHQKATLDEGIATGSLGQAFRDLAPAIAAGTTTADDAQQVADKLGISLEDATAAITSLKTATDQFVSSGVSALPAQGAAIDTFASNIQSAFQKVASASKDGAGDVKAAQDELFAALDPQRAIDLQNKQTEAIIAFQKNIDTLIAEGNRHAAAQLIVAGPEKGAQLAQGLVDDPAKAKSFDDGVILGQKVREGYRTDLESHAAELGATAVTLADGTIVPIADFINADQTVPGAVDGLNKRIVERFHPDFTGRVSLQVNGAAAALAADPTISQAAGDKALATVAAFGGNLSLADAVTLAIQVAHDQMDADGQVTGAAQRLGERATARFHPNFTGRVSLQINGAAAALANDPTISQAAGEAGLKAIAPFARNLTLGQASTLAVAAAKDVIRKDPTLGVEFGKAGEKATGKFKEKVKPGQAAKEQLESANVQVSSALQLGNRMAEAGVVVGNRFSTGIAQGITGHQIDVTNAAAAVAQAAIDQANTTFGNQSPSRVGRVIGRNLTLGMALGIKSATPEAEQAAQDVSDATIARLQRLVDQELAAGAAQAAAQAAAASFISSATGSLTGVGSDISQFGSDLASATGEQTSALHDYHKAFGTYADDKKKKHALDAEGVSTLAHLQDAQARLNAAVAAGGLKPNDAQKRLIADLKREVSSATSEFVRIGRGLDAVKSKLVTDQASIGTASTTLGAANRKVRDASDPVAFIHNLNQQTEAARRFQKDLKKLNEEGFTDLAKNLAAAGPEAAGKLADAFAGNKGKAKQAEAAIDTAAAFTASYTKFLEDQFAPKVAKIAGDAGRTAGDALATNVHKATAQVGDITVGATAPALTTLSEQVEAFKPTVRLAVDSTAIRDFVVPPPAPVPIHVVPPAPVPVTLVPGPLNIQERAEAVHVEVIPILDAFAVPGPIAVVANVQFGPLPPLPDLTANVTFGPLPVLPPLPALIEDVTFGKLPNLSDLADLADLPSVTVPLTFVPEVGGLAAQLAAAVQIGPVPVDVTPHLLALAALPPLDVEVVPTVDTLTPLTVDVTFGPIPVLPDLTAVVQLTFGPIPALPPLPAVLTLTSPVVAAPLPVVAPVASRVVQDGPQIIELDLVFPDGAFANTTVTIPVPKGGTPGATTRLRARVEAAARA